MGPRFRGDDPEKAAREAISLTARSRASARVIRLQDAHPRGYMVFIRLFMLSGMRHISTEQWIARRRGR